jgi:molybdopterin-biosynthesis enzyme MoeA-like protein
MRIEIIIGEPGLVLGETSDRLGPVLARALRSLGLPPARIVLAGDDPLELASILVEAASRADLIVVAGALDSRDRALAEAAHGSIPLETDELTPPVGVARGTGFRLGAARGFWLPADPAAMEAMLEARVLPAISSQRGEAIWTTRLRLSAIEEPEARRALERRASALTEDVRLGVSRRDEEHEVVVRARGARLGEAARRGRRAAAEVCERLGRAVHGPGGESLAEAVANALRARGRTLAAAEVGAGARTIAELARARGAGEVLVLALTSGSLETISKLVAPGPPVEGARDLAEAVAQRAGASVGLAIIGPADSNRDSFGGAGLLHFALVGEGGPREERLDLGPGSGSELGRRAAAAALRLVLDSCREGRG